MLSWWPTCRDKELKRVEKLALFTFIISVTALGTGCRANQSDGGGYSNYVSAKEATQEYKEAAKKWDLAPGSVWPTEPYPDRFNGGEAFYDKGSGDVDASFDWWCSWVRELTEAQTEERRKTAEAHVLGIRETPFYYGLTPGDRLSFNEDVVEPALAGDFYGASRVAELSCR